jgi:K(+)-stimulated pyrophosphate-energized sodium pump
MNIIIVSIISGILALLTALFLSIKITRQKIENPVLSEIAFLIQEGAMAFLKKEYTILSIFVIAMFVIISVFIDFNILKVDKINELNSNGNITSSGPWTAISYLFGAIGSALAGFIGMSIAVRGNSRTAEAAQKGLNPSLRVAFNTGTVMGMTVVGIGIIGVSILWLVFGNINIIAGFGFGASSIALFARVGGGIYTKAADVGADLVGKVEAGIPEDDPRNPATIADNVGDNVGDVAGMGADLFESYAGSIIATIALALFVPTLAKGLSTESAIIFPILIGGIGIFSSIIGTLLVRTKPDANMSSLLWSLRIGIFGAGIISLIGTYIATIYLDIHIYYFCIIVIGIVVGQVIGTATEYFTSYEYSPVKWIAKQSLTGHPSNIIAGIAVGLYSTLIPALSVVIGIWAAYQLGGLYGIGLSSVGMLATLGITLSTDAYGPVADNAGGLAEQAGLDPEVRERTDALDALGNTTAATGKGFAIGSAVLTALALMAAYANVIEVKSFNLLEPPVLIGVLIGSTLPFIFSGMTMQAVGVAAGAMIEEVRRQFREIPGLREGKKGVKPDAARAVEISTTGSLKAMILPSLTAIIAPIIVGIISEEALGGLLAGSIVSGFLLAIFMANAGGAWDNAKKYIELGNHGGKGSEAHKAAVSGDTVGDPFKDTSGPAINILIKLMAIVSLIFGPLFIGINIF